MKSVTILFCAVFACWLSCVNSVERVGRIEEGMQVLDITRASSDSLQLDIVASYNNDVKAKWTVGLGIPEGMPFNPQDVACGNHEGNYRYCYMWGTEYIFAVTTERSNCYLFSWETKQKYVKDCFSMSDPEAYWFGGAESPNPAWPLNSAVRTLTPFTPQDYLSDEIPESIRFNGGVLDAYWLNSRGAYIYALSESKLFVSYNEDNSTELCLASRWEEPYARIDNERLRLSYRMCLADDIITAHKDALEYDLHYPSEVADTTMMIYPVWSTWAYFRANINASIVLNFAQDIVNNGFTQNSQLEIDDLWESCYGDAEFEDSFGDVSELIQELNNLGFRTTVWVHPFIDCQCDSFTTADSANYFVQDQNGLTALTSWWDGDCAGLIDFSRTEPVEWWRARLENLRTTYGIDGFKFDAGETTWLPFAPAVNISNSLLPNTFNSRYIEAVSYFGTLTEARSAYRAQTNNMYFRYLDRDTDWTSYNGLKTLIPTGLLFGLLGYPFILPDMVAGNAGADATEELYIRWLEVNVFLPSIQLSIPPWIFSDEAVTITQNMLNLRYEHAHMFYAAANQSITDGTPMIRPLWWHDPTDPINYEIDTEFLLGDFLLVAPILEEGADRRDIYLPTGTWHDKVNDVNITGPATLTDFAAAIDVLPHFVLMSDD